MHVLQGARWQNCELGAKCAACARQSRQEEVRFGRKLGVVNPLPNQSSGILSTARMLRSRSVGTWGVLRSVQSEDNWVERHRACNARLGLPNRRLRFSMD